MIKSIIKLAINREYFKCSFVLWKSILFSRILNLDPKMLTDPSFWFTGKSCLWGLWAKQAKNWWLCWPNRSLWEFDGRIAKWSPQTYGSLVNPNWREFVRGVHLWKISRVGAVLCPSSWFGSCPRKMLSTSILNSITPRVSSTFLYFKCYICVLLAIWF